MAYLSQNTTWYSNVKKNVNGPPEFNIILSKQRKNYILLNSKNKDADS